MKQRVPHWVWILVVCLVCTSVFVVYRIPTYTAFRRDQEAAEEFKEERTGAWEALQLEIEKTKDPKLGYVPKERLLKAYQYTEQLRKQRAAQRAIPGINWQERGPNNVAGRTNALLIDANDPTGNTIWAAGSTGGLWKTTNMKATNTTWKPINDFFANLAIVTIAQDPVDPKVMYFGTGDINVRGLGIWKSTNGGTSWTHLTATSKGGDFFDINRIIVTPARTVLVATSTGVMRSVNQGETWGNVTFGDVSDLIQASNGTVWIGVEGILRRSTNDGQTFTSLSSAPSIGTENTVLAVAPSNPNVIYAMGSNWWGDVGGMARSDNGGASWTSLPIPRIVGGSGDFTRGQAWYDLEIAVDPENENHVWIGGIDLLKSTNKGASWTSVSHWYGGFGLPYVHADQHFILFDKNNPKAAYFACDGGVFSCADTRVISPAFTGKNSNYNITYFYAVALHSGSGSNYIMAGAQDNGTQVMNATAIGNGKEVTGGDGMFCHIDQDKPDIQISSYVYNSYHISTDGGKSFRRMDNDQQSGRFVNPTDWHNISNRLYAATSSGYYRVYTDPVNVSTRKDVYVPVFNGGQVSAVMCSDKVADRVWFGLGNGTVVRVDNAASDSPTFTLLRSGNGYISSIAVDPADENHLLVTSSRYGTIHIVETKNNGASWVSTDGNLPDMPVRWAIFSPNNSDHALIATEIGVWSTDDLNGSATSWEPSNSGLANVRTDMLQYRTSDNLVAAATFGRGVFTTNFFGNKQPQTTVTVAPSTDISPGDFVLTATATDVDGTIARVDFYNGNILLASDSVAPYTFNWTNVPAGTYSITAQAIDNKDAAGVSAPVTVTVVPNQLPVVNIAISTALVQIPAEMLLTATATDADGTIAKVDFYNGTTLLYSDQTAPYTLTIRASAAARYTLTAQATDNKGGVRTSRILQAVATSAQPIEGPECLDAQTTDAFELTSDYRVNATGYTWRYTGSAQSNTSVAGLPYRTLLAAGDTFTVGKMCVDVTYSEPPYTRTYCKDVSICVYLRGKLPDNLQVAPNPFTNTFSFVLPILPTYFTAELYDARGARQYIQLVAKENGLMEVHPPAGLAPGMYILKLQTHTDKRVFKLIKE